MRDVCGMGKYSYHCDTFVVVLRRTSREPLEEFGGRPGEPWPNSAVLLPSKELGDKRVKVLEFFGGRPSVGTHFAGTQRLSGWVRYNMRGRRPVDTWGQTNTNLQEMTTATAASASPRLHSTYHGRQVDRPCGKTQDCDHCARSPCR